jgi:AAA15 family ATPase/GTPase
VKITSIEIKNFRSISNINISNLPNFVVIVGENGVGKSSIFEAIGFVKSMIGPQAQQDQNWWASRMRLRDPVTIGQKEARIRIHIEPTTEQEKIITNNATAIAGLKIQKTNSGELNLIIENTNNASVLLQSWRRREGIGGLEIIPANRRYPEGQLSLQSRQLNDEQFFHERISNLENKYHDAKQMFVNFYLHDLARPQDPPIYPEAKEMVETLLGRKVSVELDTSLFPHILIESPDGPVEIDSLSSGQRELFMTYVGIYSTRLTHSIILFDEPDLHLHASMQKKAIQYLRKYANSGNQVFLTTHSLDMITETAEESLFHLSPTNEKISQLQKLTDEKEKLRIFQELGASKYTYVNFKKIIFVEGESDYNIFQKSAMINPDIRFQQIGGVSKITPEVLSNASQIESFFMIRDRDFLDTNEIEQQERKYNKKIYFLRRRNIENYILDSDELFEIYQKYGNNEIKTKTEMLDYLKKIADEQFEQVIVDYYNFKNTRDVNPPELKLTSKENAEDGLNRIYQIKEERIKTSKSKISSEILEIRNN